MTDAPDLTPLELQRVGNHLRFVLKSQADILPELPADYEQLVAHRLGLILAEQAQFTAEIDLQNLAGLSSRQLGSLIALQKVLRQRLGNVPVKGVSSGVRHLMRVTHTDQLFGLA